MLPGGGASLVLALHAINADCGRPPGPPLRVAALMAMLPGGGASLVLALHAINGDFAQALRHRDGALAALAALMLELERVVAVLPMSSMRLPAVIAIDGPAGSGKSTLGALLAERLGYLYFDTGVMYRALTLVAMRARINLSAGDTLEALARQVRITVVPSVVNDGRQYTVLVDNEDITWAIRDPLVERNVSLVARYAGVRREMVRQQQLIGQRGEVVMVGRDIGTVVMPEAELKIFLDASIEERARRRASERRANLHADTFLAQVQEDLVRRDELDQHVLRPATDAVILQTDGMTLADELEWIMDYLAQRA
jgi:CMP/dCMP kinase